MIAEMVLFVIVLVSGDLLLRRLGVASPLLRTSLAIPTVLGAAIVVGLALAVVRLPAPPVVGLAVAVLASVAAAAPVIGRRSRSLWATAAGALATSLVVLSVWRYGLLRFTPDSFQYATSGGLFHQTGTASAHFPRLLERRSFGLAYVSGVGGDVNDRLVLPSLSPLLAVSVVIAVAAIAFLLVRHTGSGRVTATALSVGATVFVATTSRFLFNAFYINSHMWFALAILGFVGLVLLRTLGVPGVSLHAVAVVGGLFLASMVLLRPEGLLVALTVVLPAILASDRLPVSVQRSWVLALGATGVAWFGGILFVEYLVEPDLSPPTSVLGSLALSTLVFGAGLLPAVVYRSLRRWHVWTALGVGTVLLAWMVSSRFWIFRETALATYQNVVEGAGLWGRSLVLLAAALAVTWVFSRAKRLELTALPLLAAVPLSIALAYLRGAPFRVSPDDSLNRMLLHYFPVAVIALVHAVVVARRADDGLGVAADAATGDDRPSTQHTLPGSPRAAGGVRE